MLMNAACCASGERSMELLFLLLLLPYVDFAEARLNVDPEKGTPSNRTSVLRFLHDPS